MKNKKAEQIEAKKKHKEQLKSNRRTEASLERFAPELSQKAAILIVCEGKNTEPSYFNRFKLTSATVKCIGEGRNPVSLVKKAAELKSKDKGNYDQVWCVFDKDDFSETDFNSAIKNAEAEGFGVAYSNQAFEYWLILHFDAHQGGPMPRRDYNDKINKLLQPFGVEYDGKNSKKISEKFFGLLDGIDEKTGVKRVEDAIKRAKENCERFDHTNFAEKESSTTVFKLVEELLKHI